MKERDPDIYSLSLNNEFYLLGTRYRFDIMY